MFAGCACVTLHWRATALAMQAPTGQGVEPRCALLTLSTCIICALAALEKAHGAQARYACTPLLS